MCNLPHGKHYQVFVCYIFHLWCSKTVALEYVYQSSQYSLSHHNTWTVHRQKTLLVILKHSRSPSGSVTKLAFISTNFTLSSLPLLSESTNSHITVIIHAKWSAAKSPAVDWNLIRRNCELSLNCETKSQWLYY